MDDETKKYIDQHFEKLTLALGHGFRINDAEHRHLLDYLESLKRMIVTLQYHQKAEQVRLDRLEKEVFGPNT